MQTKFVEARIDKAFAGSERGVVEKCKSFFHNPPFFLLPKRSMGTQAAFSYYGRSIAECMGFNFI